MAGSAALPASVRLGDPNFPQVTMKYFKKKKKKKKRSVTEVNKQTKQTNKNPYNSMISTTEAVAVYKWPKARGIYNTW